MIRNNGCIGSRRYRRGAVSVSLLWLICGGLLAPIERWAQPLIARRQELANMRLPPDKVVYIENPLGVLELPDNDPDYRLPKRPFFAMGWWPLPPADWHPPVFYHPPALEFLCSDDAYDGLIFLNTLTTRGGSSRTVLLQVACTAFGPRGHGIVLRAEVYRFDFWHPSHPAYECSTIWGGWIGAQADVKIWAGQLDLKDASAFTVRHTIENRLDNLRATLIDPEDWRAAGQRYPMRTPFVVFEPRAGPERPAM